MFLQEREVVFNCAVHAFMLLNINIMFRCKKFVAYVAFRRAECPATGDALASAVCCCICDVSVDESILLSAGQDSGHFN
jgi:hypothetical protein